MAMPDEPDRFSHPAGPDGTPVAIQKHLDDVVKRVGWIVPEGATTPSGASLLELTKRIALVHDIGKLTPWFQQHIGIKKGETGQNPTHHAPLGALLAYYVLDAVGYNEEECLVGLVAVGKHHGTLPNIVDDVFDRTNWNVNNPEDDPRLGEAVVEANEIHQTVPSLANSLVEKSTNSEGTWREFFGRLIDSQTFPSLFRQIHDTVRIRSQPDSTIVSEDFYACVLQVWSALVLADKTGAASVTSSVEITEKNYRPQLPDSGVLRNHINGLQERAQNNNLTRRECSLNRQRRTANEGVRDTVDEFVQTDESVATITLPTGLGKTLTGLEAAFKIRDAEERGGRIIYALPYTSIIDQVVDEVTEVFETDGTDNLLTIHHYLAETVTELHGEASSHSKEYARLAAMLGESWRSGLIVTTFVQLFETLAGPRNTQSMKLPALYDSVVILDEPQTLPLEWWSLVERLVKIITDEYNSTVIAMTATQPNLFDINGDRSRELVPDREQYFSGLDRVEYAIDESVEEYLDSESEPLEYDVAAAKISAGIESSTSVLAICNTIDSARELTESAKESFSEPIVVNEAFEDVLKEVGQADAVKASSVVETIKAKDFEKPALLHLSTRIRPCDRLTLIQIAKKLCKSERPFIVVSTQLVEAGVDISFDRVYRDFAPMDSIVQAAGRCNRSYERDQGTVTIWLLEAPEKKKELPAKAVYGLQQNSLPKITGSVLAGLRDDGSDVIPEARVAWDGVRAYYAELEDRGVGDDSYVDYVDGAMADELHRLSLIDQKLAVDVLVTRTPDEWATAQEIVDTYDDREFDRLDTLMTKSQSMRVSVPIYDEASKEARKIGDIDPLHQGTDVRWLHTDEERFANFFDATNGLVIPDSTVEARIL
jgi:CRISPR-associated endonuclease Cas3-HD